MAQNKYYQILADILANGKMQHNKKGNIKYLDECGYNFVIMVKGMKKLVNQIIRSVRGKFEQDREKSIRGSGNIRISGPTVEPF